MMNSLLSSFIFAVGLVVLARVAFEFLKMLYQFVRPSIKLSTLGEWSVVTGPVSGIGRAVALELAKRGQNVFLVGIGAKDLKAVQEEISTASPSVKTEVMEMDLSKIGPSQVEAYKDAIARKDVGILVNNAGLSYRYTKYFHEVDLQRVDAIVAVNCCAVTTLARVTISQMEAKKKGAVVNVSSAGGVLPHELHAVYGASKAYVKKLSEDLALEYSRMGVAIQCVVPFFVVSNMSKVRRASLSVPSPETFAKCVVSQIGYSGVLCPYPIHALMLFVLGLVPKWLLERQIGAMHHKIRKKGHKKFGVKKTD